MYISYRNLQFPVLDLGLFNRHMYSLINFDLSANPLKGFNLLGDHAHIFLIFLAPLYYLWPDPRLLLVVQVFAVTLSIFPIYYIAQHYLESKVSGILWSLSYLLFFGFWAALAYSFHDAPVAVLPISWALYHLLVSKKIRWLVLWLAILCLIREDMPLVVAMFGLYLAVIDRNWKTGLAVIIGSLAYMSLIMKYLLGSLGHGYSYTQNPFGNGMVDVARASFTQPIAVFKELFLSPRNKTKTLLYMLGSFGGLSLLAPQVLLLMAPLWAGRTLTLQYWRWSTIMHYSASQAPFLAVSAIVGLATVVSLLSYFNFFSAKLRKLMIVSISVGVVITSLVVSFLTNNIQFMRVLVPSAYSLTATQKSVYEASGLIPKLASVGVQAPFVNLTSRQAVYNIPLPDGIYPDYVVLVDSIDIWPFRSSAELIRYKDTLKSDNGYIEIFNKDEVFLLKKSK